MTTPLQPSDSNTRQRRGPRQRIGCEVPDMALEEFRAHTAGLSNRLPLPSLESMRAGTAMNPHTLTRRYLSAARRIGLPREWAQRHLVWLTRTIDSLWPMEATGLEALEHRAMALEAADDAAEKCHDLKKDVESLRHRMATQMAEIAADSLVAAKLQRRLEEMEQCK